MILVNGSRSAARQTKAPDKELQTLVQESTFNKAAKTGVCVHVSSTFSRVFVFMVPSVPRTKFAHKQFGSGVTGHKTIRIR